MGYVARVVGGVLQRRRRLGPPLSGYARPTRRRAGGNRGGGTVARLPQPGVARVGFAPALAGAAGLQSHILALFYQDWSHWLAPAIVVLGLGAAASLAVHA